MKQVILYIAMSLDGYIADEQGMVDWIQGQDAGAGADDTFTPFFVRTDTVVIGRRTFNQIVNVLSPGKWPYDGATTYVLTHRHDADDTHNIRFRDTDACRLVDELRQEAGRGIWICGGAEVAGKLIAADRIDIYHIAVIPVILGRGIRLFGCNAPTMELEMKGTRSYNGIVELVYQRKR